MPKSTTKRLERSDFEGVCYVTERGRTIYNKGVNYADKKKKIKNSENTVFRIASITKQFTAAAIMILQERGKLSVNDKLNKYFPDYKYGGKNHVGKSSANAFGYPRICERGYVFNTS